MQVRRSFLSIVVLLATSTALPAEIRTLTILHTNDLHSRLMPSDAQQGGFAFVAATIRRERANCTDCILLNAGDLAQGTPVSTIYRGEPIFEIANMLGFDAATLGNHDFDYGWEQTVKFLGMANYPIVSANVVDRQGAYITGKPWVILKVNGLRIGVIGAMTEGLPALVSPKALGEWKATPVVAAVTKAAEQLRSQTDLIVAVGHVSGDEEKALVVAGIPVTVSGHLHTGMTEPLTSGNNLVVRVKGYGEELGRLELKVDTEKKSVASWNWKRLTVDATRIAPVPEIAAVVKTWEDRVAERVDRPLGVSKRRLPRAEVKVLLEEAMRLAAGADFAYMNSGGVRDILPEGQLLERHVWNIMPFDNTVVWGSFKGRDLPKVVTEGKTIDPDKVYKLAVSDFTAATQQSRENFGTTGLQFPNELGYLRDALIELIRSRKVIE